MEVESAVRRRLLADQTVNGYVAGAVWKFRLMEAIEGTGQRAVVVKRDGGWAVPDETTTQEYPLVTVRCYADPDRDNDGLMVDGTALSNAFALYRAVDKVLHGKRGEVWGGDNGLLVITSQRWSEPYSVAADDQHGASSGSSEALGETVFVLAQYALQVVH